MDNWFYNVFINVPEERSVIKHQCIQHSIYWIVHLKKNILYLKRFAYIFRILVADITYVINLLGLLIPSRIWFIYIVHGQWHSVESKLLISRSRYKGRTMLSQIWISKQLNGILNCAGYVYSIECVALPTLGPKWIRYMTYYSS